MPSPLKKKKKKNENDEKKNKNEKMGGHTPLMFSCERLKCLSCFISNSFLDNKPTRVETVGKRGEG